MSLDYDAVRDDVGKAVKRAVCRLGNFVQHPQTYSPGVVPSDPHPKGLKADDKYWKEVLDVVAKDLAQLNTAYAALRVTLQDAIDTYNKPVSTSTTLLTRRIIDGQPSGTMVAGAWGKLKSLWG